MLSLAHLTFMQAGPLELISLAKLGGFDAVGLRLIDPAPEAAFFPVVTDAGLRRRAKAALEATGLTLLDIEAVWLWPQTQVPKLRPALEAGAELGARNLLVAGNDADRNRMTDRLAELCGMAREYGMGVGFEFIPYTALNSLAFAQEILKAADQPHAGLLIDALHLARSGGSPADIAAIDPALIAYGHLCDAPASSPGLEGLRAEARGARLYPGDGGLPLADFLNALPADKPIALEAPSAAYGHDDSERARRAGAACRAVLASIGRS
ncbi:sugar phosphate isomerase/epimerase family protein [Bosea sp. TAB14]|jgi:sugar phosphate isomerase/epimerase|uniref:sugar phosphate isomerase/epimerase family protein n=1 Tax=Bosea sp. TAB14 TaxID=3237481 RepID=UPI003F8E372D